MISETNYSGCRVFDDVKVCCEFFVLNSLPNSQIIVNDPRTKHGSDRTHENVR